ncbi:DUF2786 domain-containing protein [Streptomyces sp. NA02950]|uniref:DUF2786 domain-containing protein n=1 Tax=Streptomyces sp. NA02950 TaxID=2742137 RepID=UPI0015920858|nr:DUF2786 domain-containing protein [Streptomyces sp. NA02950]QKV92296.1 DUF2786 domain-containing protein [Streptomyces sp. NA02950]
MSEYISDGLLAKVRALLAKAEDAGATEAEAEAFTAKAADLMAKHGIERALLADAQPETDRPTDRVVLVDNPWGGPKKSLLCYLAQAMRCEGIYTTRRDAPGYRVHLFGYASDLERLEVLYTSLLLQMANGAAHLDIPYWDTPRRYRFSWMVGFASTVAHRVKAAEDHARWQAGNTTAQTGTGRSAELVLADRSAVVGAMVKEHYGRVRSRKVTVTGTGYRAGQEAGRRADIGTTRLGASAARQIGGAR